MENIKQYADLWNADREQQRRELALILEEREACARLCEQWGTGREAKYCAALIRARNSNNNI